MGPWVADVDDVPHSFEDLKAVSEDVDEGLIKMSFDYRWEVGGIKTQGGVPLRVEPSIILEMLPPLLVNDAQDTPLPPLLAEVFL